jgi:hypothetical protein
MAEVHISALFEKSPNHSFTLDESAVHSAIRRGKFNLSFRMLSD